MRGAFVCRDTFKTKIEVGLFIKPIERSVLFLRFTFHPRNLRALSFFGKHPLPIKYFGLLFFVYGLLITSGERAQSIAGHVRPEHRDYASESIKQDTDHMSN